MSETVVHSHIPNKQIHSMTGQGRSKSVTHLGICLVEVRTLNSKNKDVSLRIPFDNFSLEAKIRDLALKRFSRGRIEILIQFQQEKIGKAEKSTLLNEDALTKTLTALNEYMKSLPTFSHLSLHDYLPALLHRREFFSISESTQLTEEDIEAMLCACEEAFLSCEDFRKREGEALQEDMQIHLNDLLDSLAQCENLQEQHKSDLEEKWRKRLQDLPKDQSFSPEKIAQEAFFYLERIDVSEEIQRVRTHLTEIHRVLQSETVVGRRLDFLCQELGREWNTIGSKIQNSTIQHTVVQAKLSLERFREQVQNIE